MKIYIRSKKIYCEIDFRDRKQARHLWHLSSYGYVARRKYWKGNPKGQMTYLHREIMGAVSGQFVDHKDGNPLNNTRKNLRFCSKAENQYNQRKRLDNTSGYKGVYWNRLNKNWRVKINYKNKTIEVGSFSKATDAALAYDSAALKYHGQFARTNF